MCRLIGIYRKQSSSDDGPGLARALLFQLPQAQAKLTVVRYLAMSAFLNRHSLLDEPLILIQPSARVDTGIRY